MLDWIEWILAAKHPFIVVDYGSEFVLIRPHETKEGYLMKWLRMNKVLLIMIIHNILYRALLK